MPPQSRAEWRAIRRGRIAVSCIVSRGLSRWRKVRRRVIVVGGEKKKKKLSGEWLTAVCQKSAASFCWWLTFSARCRASRQSSWRRCNEKGLKEQCDSKLQTVFLFPTAGKQLVGVLSSCTFVLSPSTTKLFFFFFPPSGRFLLCLLFGRPTFRLLCFNYARMIWTFNIIGLPILLLDKGIQNNIGKS